MSVIENNNRMREVQELFNKLDSESPELSDAKERADELHAQCVSQRKEVELLKTENGALREITLSMMHDITKANKGIRRLSRINKNLNNQTGE